MTAKLRMRVAVPQLFVCIHEHDSYMRIKFEKKEKNELQYV